MTIRIVVKNENKKSNHPDQTFALEDLLISIGSSNEATLRLVGDKIALEQAVIVNENQQPLLINQAKGTILNDLEIEQGFPHQLKSGDQVRIGFYHLTIELNGHLGAAKPASTYDENRLLEDASSADEQNYLSPDFEENQLFQAADATADKAEAGSFADILSSLRKDEDQFYFQLIESDGARRRILVESDEIKLGWDTVNNFFSTDKETTLDKTQAIVRKDWNGVTIYPNGDEAILINDLLLETGARLRNNDKLIFSRPLSDIKAQAITLVFCEPAALVELNAILPQQLVSSALEANQSGEIMPDLAQVEPSPQPNNDQFTSSTTRTPRAKKVNQFYFGYFMIPEIIIMVIATILTAILTYVLLEFS